MCKRLTASGPAKVRKIGTKIGGAARETEFSVWVCVCVTHESRFTESSAIFTYVWYMQCKYTVLLPVWISSALFTVVAFRRQARGLKYLELTQSLFQGKSLIRDFKDAGSATVPTCSEQSLACCEYSPYTFQCHAYLMCFVCFSDWFWKQCWIL